MGYIKPEVYQSICADAGIDVPKIFVETGTFKGGVPLRMLEENGNLDPFEKVYTVELGYDICQIASRRYQLFEAGTPETSILHTNDKDEEFIYNSWQEYFSGKLTLCHGDSANEIESILKTVNEPVCFWLDAHAGASKYAKGPEDCPLIQELELIAKHDIKNHIIAIDDSNMLGEIQKDEYGNITCDYSNITMELVQEKILKINPNYDIGVYKPYAMEMLIAFVK
tara:strand:+ start:3568 stop:4242 length:675 start_codon:yes stop_codon:yes gene_type:complete